MIFMGPLLKGKMRVETVFLLFVFKAEATYVAEGFYQ